MNDNLKREPHEVFPRTQMRECYEKIKSTESTTNFPKNVPITYEYPKEERDLITCLLYLDDRKDRDQMSNVTKNTHRPLCEMRNPVVEYEVTGDRQHLDNGTAQDSLAYPSYQTLTLTIEQVCHYLQMSKPVVLKLLNKPGFPKFRVGNRTYVSRELLHVWVNEQCVKEGKYA